VESAQEFSAATVATTISLATVILAYAELASFMGLWLLWTVVTTAAGILVVRLMAPVILRKMVAFGGHRPTLHEFLGVSYRSDTLARGAAIFTSLGFLGALAVELTVGSAFLAKLVPGIPFWIAVLILAAIGVTYTALGGFRAVIVTDRAQMIAIWGTILSLALVAVWQIAERGGLSFLATEAPPALYDFSWRDGLLSFLVGIFVINVPTFVADMSIWQRIAGSKDEDIVQKGLARSVLWAAVSWGGLALIACALVVLVSVKEGENPLFAFIVNLGSTPNFVSAILFVIIVAGLYAASLSTASTQLIAATHAIHTDILKLGSDRETLAEAEGELKLSRTILIGGALISIVVVQVLVAIGFSIADLVFAVYGAQLGMVPAVIVALYSRPETLSRLGSWATLAVGAGFISGWSCAGLGKMWDDSNLIFLSPVVSLVISSLALLLGVVVSRICASRGRYS
jgi:Na+/proline symporter